MSSVAARQAQAAQEAATGIALLDQVEKLAKEGLSATRIAGALDIDDVPVSEERVKGLMRKLRREKYGPHLATQLFLKELHETKGIICRIYPPNPDPHTERISRVFWTYDWCLDMWRN